MQVIEGGGTGRWVVIGGLERSYFMGPEAKTREGALVRFACEPRSWPKTWGFVSDLSVAFPRNVEAFRSLYLEKSITTPVTLSQIWMSLDWDHHHCLELVKVDLYFLACFINALCPLRSVGIEHNVLLYDFETKHAEFLWEAKLSVPCLRRAGAYSSRSSKELLPRGIGGWVLDVLGIRHGPTPWQFASFPRDLRGRV